MENNSFSQITPIFKGVSVLFSIILISVIYHFYKVQSIRQTWIQTDGVVVGKSVKGWWDDQKHRRYYMVYEYQAGEKIFKSSQFNIKDDSIKNPRNLTEYLKEGDSLPVYYNPDDPAQAVANIDFLRNSALFFIVTTGFIVMASTMIIKEASWLQQTNIMRDSLGENYTGGRALPVLPLIEDNSSHLILNTGMSVFWNFGLPFFALSFICIIPLLFFSSVINPGWNLSTYLLIIGGSLTVCTLGGLFIRNAYTHQLVIDVENERILDKSRFLFKERVSSYSFSDVSELRLYREKWRHDNPLRNWILYLQTKSKKSVFISYRHRDIQPASRDYLKYIQKRVEFLLGVSDCNQA